MRKRIAWAWHRSHAVGVMIALLTGGLALEVGVAMCAPDSWFEAAGGRMPLAAKIMLGVMGVLILLIVLSGILAVPRGWGKTQD